jgi:uncharacterized membrane protein YfcA
MVLLNSKDHDIPQKKGSGLSFDFARILRLLAPTGVVLLLPSVLGHLLAPLLGIEGAMQWVLIGVPFVLLAWGVYTWRASKSTPHKAHHTSKENSNNITSLIIGLVLAFCVFAYLIRPL